MTADLDTLISRVEEGAGEDRELDAAIIRALAGSPTDHWFRFGDEFLTDNLAKRLTSSLDAVLSLMEAKLPGFWWRGGTCFLSSEAIVCPDHNCPTHGARLMVECPPSMPHWNEGIEVEIRPGSQGALVRALLAAVLRTLRALKETRHDG